MSRLRKEQYKNTIVLSGSAASEKVTLAKRVVDLSKDKDNLRIELRDSLKRNDYTDSRIKLFVIVFSCTEQINELEKQIEEVPEFVLTENKLVYWDSLANSLIANAVDSNKQHKFNLGLAVTLIQDYHASIPVMSWSNSVSVIIQTSTDLLASGIANRARRSLSSQALQHVSSSISDVIITNSASAEYDTESFKSIKTPQDFDKYRKSLDNNLSHDVSFESTSESVRPVSKTKDRKRKGGLQSFDYDDDSHLNEISEKTQKDIRNIQDEAEKETTEEVNIQGSSQDRPDIVSKLKRHPKDYEVDEMNVRAEPKGRKARKRSINKKPLKPLEVEVDEMNV
ncbi:hypothetical protein E3Q22_01821 [Wallemia mellicola]|uniref:Uncharacterized protein n=1 Tax=Wallemia mellicola TaxID=1708541 RepID=A0A4T0MC04_9BASI|nr:hypothetical protein E3Q22_01821 [Wallemia mellicola]